MADTTIKKIDSRFSPKGEQGQKYLVSGITMAMRLWDDEQPSEQKEWSEHVYETVGYVLKGKAELHSEGQVIILEPGNSWVVPKGARHKFNFLEPFTAIEVTHPPARVDDRDDPQHQNA